MGTVGSPEDLNGNSGTSPCIRIATQANENALRTTVRSINRNCH